MPRKAGLTARQVETIRRPGLFGDGGGLYLRVTPSGGKFWVYRFMLNGRRRDMGLGAVELFSLADARARALEARRLCADGIDPIDTRQGSRLAGATATAKLLTVRDCAEQYVAAHRAGWNSAKHQQQWENTLAAYVYPKIGELPVVAIDTNLVVQVLEQTVTLSGGDGRKAPFWQGRPETASRVRGRIEAVLDWATARGYRTGENPARWKGHLENVLPKKTKVRRVEHHAALPYSELAAFMVELRRQDGVAARALEFTILTAARSGEVLGARWAEIDTANKLWIVPPDRMKAGREHRVPLSDAAKAIVDQMAAIRSSDYLFPGRLAGRPFGPTAMQLAVSRAGYAGNTVHGFRSTFSDWCAEMTNFPSEVREMALAHAVGDKVEAAYRRGDLFQKRRQLAEAWARYCAAPREQGIVVPLHAVGKIR